MSTTLIQAWATGISTVLAAGTASTVGIIHAIAVYQKRIAPTSNGGNSTNE